MFRPGRLSNGGTSQLSGVISDVRLETVKAVLCGLLCNLPGE